MGLKEVVDTIVAGGASEAEKIVSVARSKAGETVRDGEKQTAGIVEARAAEAREHAAALKKREVASAELEAKKLRLNAEKDLLAAVREAARERLKTLPDDTRKRHLQVLVERSGARDGRVLVAKRDEALARAAGIDVAGTFDGLGGVIIESADGSTREDLRYENLLDEVWRDALHDVAAALFGDDGGNR